MRKNLDFPPHPLILPPFVNRLSFGWHQSAGNPSRDECPVQRDGMVCGIEAAARAVRCPQRLASAPHPSSRRGESAVNAEGDFQRPARQLTPSAREREFTLEDNRPIIGRLT